MAWSLEEEIIACAPIATTDVAVALRAIGLLSGEASNAFELRLHRDWYPGGAETYLYEFSLYWPPAQELRLLLKACIAFGGLAGTRHVVAEWMARRRVLTAAGATVSLVFGEPKSTVIEEWVPMSLREAVEQGHKHERFEIAKQLGLLAAVFDSEGFAPVSLHDLRSHGSDVVMVDFGADLGPPGKPVEHSANLGLILRTAKLSGLDEFHLEAVSATYDAIVSAHRP